jgi:WD40 repeat protein
MPTPPPTDFNASNHAQFVRVQSYAKALEGFLGETLFDLRMDAMAYSPDGRYVAIAGCTGNWSGSCISDVLGYSESFIVIQDAKTAEVVARLPEKQADISGLAFTANGEKLVYSINPVRIVVWDIESGQIEHVLFQDNNTYSDPKIAVSPDDTMIAAVFASQLLVWNTVSGEQIADLPAYRYLSDFPQFSADSSRLAVFNANYGAQIIIYDTSTWEQISSIRSSSEEGVRAAFSPDGGVIAIYERFRENPEITLWDADTGAQIGVLQDVFNFISGIAFSVDGKLLLISGTPSSDQLFYRITVWDVERQQPIGNLNSEIYPTKILFSADGSSFLTDDSFYPNLFLWSLPDAAMVSVVQAAEAFFEAFSQGDFKTAALYYQPTSDDVAYFESFGMDTSDLPEFLKGLCANSATGCLPVADIVSSAKEYQGDYSLMMHFALPDGSLYTDPDGFSEVDIYAAIEADGTAKVNLLPYFLYP